MKKIRIFTLITILLMGTTSAAPGEILGNTHYSDIAAYINNYPIESYNIEGGTAIAAADLCDYGFTVTEEGRTIQIAKTGTDYIAPKSGIYLNGRRAGIPAAPYCQTDITAVVNGTNVPCYSVNGKIVIMFDAMSAFGEVAWDGKNRQIYLTCSDIPVGPWVPIPENPNVVTMYADDGRTILVDSDQVEAYKSVNWHTDIAEVTKTLYAKDGRTMTAFLSEIPTYLSLNWYSYPPHRKMVALTFDDGPSSYTEQILDTLNRHGAKATFFVVGNRVNNYQDILLRTASMGMEIGNHSYSHPQLTKLSWNGLIEEKSKTDNNIYSIIGAYPTVFRPPYGSTSQTVAAAFGKPVILWSVDTLDWKSRNKNSVVNSVMSTVKDGDIILMHDIYSSTAAAVTEIVPRLIKEGYELVTVSELANYRKGGLVSGQKYSQIR